MKNEWQTIETAPAGVSVWVGFWNPLGNWRSVKAVYYKAYTVEYDGDEDPSDWCDSDDLTETWYCPEGWYEDLYCTIEDASYVKIDIDPEVWMPLPEPPEDGRGTVPVMRDEE